jgi:hypothetical protein
MTAKLYIGRRFTGISLEPDGRHPKMCRVRWPDGQLSSMGNRTRAKDAALRYARGLAQYTGSGLVHYWHRLQTAAEAPPAAASTSQAPCPTPTMEAAAGTRQRVHTPEFGPNRSVAWVDGRRAWKRGRRPF